MRELIGPLGIRAHGSGTGPGRLENVEAGARAVQNHSDGEMDLLQGGHVDGDGAVVVAVPHPHSSLAAHDEGCERMH